MLDSGYQLFIPTATLGDALIARPLDAGGKHIADCYTAPLIYMSTAEVLGLPVSMVEIKLESGQGHNYLRWRNPNRDVSDWDTNGREQCSTPTSVPSWQGRTMSRTEVMGYAKGVRGLPNQKSGRNIQALIDYRDSKTLYPSVPFAYNNMAWLLTTRSEFYEPEYVREAIENATMAMSIERSADALDTLSCAYARAGDFALATSIAKEVIALTPSNQDFKLRLELFQSTPPRDCVDVN